ncbi:NAD(P)/FAD-dependent oxidoreductase [Fictibacillus phosphorivorans]|uniref:NAD(P)/FAD-dependent oxidoreductase n=1 Tax=Fictibacillus phosphorivorans TaxID=1221500 RepID=UPI00203BCBBE|nr:FAD-dependent oxidoreductase [Fictibacillus phosphorivorans]MCM3720263.1 FAD-binding oxidoreductase [Fictibacillus phosphorivorans]MCM3777941.1 FAD-binding oxidoreductase [Fictibacillus phosphorivorans]
MNIHNDQLFWPSTYTEDIQYPVLEENKTCDVLIIGGGMSGALCAYTLGKETDLDVILIDKGKPGYGSSSANSGFLQLSGDQMLHELIEQKGEQDAVYFYQLCQDALEDLKRIAKNVSEESDFSEKKSLYYASTPGEASTLIREYETLKRFDFPVEFFEPQEIASRFPFTKSAALVKNGDAELNPYRFVQTLLKDAEAAGVEIYEQTPLMRKTKNVHGFTCESENGTIQARHIIFATGYENDFLTQQLGATLNRTYSIVTEPLPSLMDQYKEWMIWESKRPYFYMRTTKDGRILAGGLDEEQAEASTKDGLINERVEQILQRVIELFPDGSPEISHSWSATFGESHDGLPYIGEHPNRLGEYYCLGFGKNGTVYNMLGATMIKDLITKGFHPASRLFTIARAARL